MVKDKKGAFAEKWLESYKYKKGDPLRDQAESIHIEEQLIKFGQKEPRLAHVLNLRYLSFNPQSKTYGLQIKEVALAMDVCKSTIDTDIAKALKQFYSYCLEAGCSKPAPATIIHSEVSQ